MTAQAKTEGTVPTTALNDTGLANMGGPLLLAQAWATSEPALEEWMPTGRAFIDSLRISEER